VVWAEDRPRAVDRMRRALREYRVHGIETNLPFHRRVLAHEAFRSGEYDTSFIERYQAELTGEREVPADLATVAVMAAAVDAARGDAGGSGGAGVGPEGRGPEGNGAGDWRRAVRWRGR